MFRPGWNHNNAEAPASNAEVAGANASPWLRKRIHEASTPTRTQERDNVSDTFLTVSQASNVTQAVLGIRCQPFVGVPSYRTSGHPQDRCGFGH